jgi:dynein intermediate chain 4, axonemal
MNCFYGHTGPIYKVRCNPFWHENENPIFLTCSYDWTVRVWAAKNGHSTEKLVCRHKGLSKNEESIPPIAEGEDQLKMQVNDICWSPKTSSVFASVAEDGRVEIWDLHRNNLAPMICHFDLDA